MNIYLEHINILLLYGFIIFYTVWEKLSTISVGLQNHKYF